jgi:hypothetical protein
MSYKRTIWIILLLLICLIGGGLYYAASVERFPCKIVLKRETIANRLRFLINSNFLTSQLEHCASSLKENPADWQRVEIDYIETTAQGWWQCSVYKAGPTGPEETLRIFLDGDGNKDITHIVR